MQQHLQSLQSLEARRLLAVIVTDEHPATLRDDDGSRITIQLDGAGTVTADVVRGRIELLVAGGTSQSILTVAVSKGDGRALARSIKVADQVGAINAGGVELRGVLSGKSLGSIQLLSLLNARVQAGWIGSLSARRMMDSIISADRVGAIDVAGDITRSTIHVAPANDKPVALQSLRIRGTLSASTIFVLGDIGAVSAAAMIDSNVTAGVRISENSTSQRLVQPLPDSRHSDDLYDFTGTFHIGQLVVSGKTKGAVAFSNTIVGAHEIGQILLYKVDGSHTGTAEHGIAAYKIGRVQRFFDAANAHKNAINEPAADFKIRQIAEPLSFIAPSASYGGISKVGAGTLTLNGSNTYTGATVINGSMLDITGTIANSGTLITGYTYVNLMPIEGVKIGSVSNHDATGVYLTHGGRYQLRNDAGAVVLSAASLGALAADLFRRSKSSIKIENVGDGTITVRTTSVGPVIGLMSSMLGRTELAGYSATGQPVEGSLSTAPYLIGAGSLTLRGNGNEVTLNSITTQSRVIPSFEVVKSEFAGAGFTTHEFAQPLMLMSESRRSIGQVMGPIAVRDVDLTQPLRFAADSTTSSDLGQLITTVTADRVGSRRLPARWVSSGNGVTVYGLADGGTVTVRDLGQTALNAVGALRKLPTSTRLRQALIDAGVTFSK